MDREWLTERELLDWLAGRLAGLKICQKCDNPAKDAAVGLLRLRVPAPDGANWTHNTPYHLCYHQCRSSREEILGQAAARFNVKWD